MALTEKVRHKSKLDSIIESFPYYIIEFVDDMQAKNSSPSTLLGYVKDFEQFHSWATREGLTKEPLKTLSTAFLEHLKLREIQNYIKFLNDEKRLKTTSVARNISSLKSIFKFLTTRTENDEGECYFYRNVMAKVDIPTVKKSASKRATKISTQILQDDEEKELIRFIEEDYIDTIKGTKREQYYIRDRERDLAIFSLFLATGLRVSELAGVNIDSIDMKHRYLNVLSKGEMNEEDVVIFRKSALPYLQQYLEIRAQRYKAAKNEKSLFLTFYDGCGQRMSVRAIQDVVYRYTKAFNKKMSPHKLRHTLATKMVKEGIPLNEVMLQLRHTSMTTTALYTNQTLQDRRDSMDKLDD